MAENANGGRDVPQKISHYSITGAIGGGGMGVVYRGEDLRDKSPVAIKILHPHLAEDESFRERFEREAHVGALLRSPYVVRLLDYGIEDGRYFIVMEFVEGQSLKDALAAGPVDTGRILRICAQTARALEEAEARGIVHRDIKPDNILLGPGDSVKVADFGIAKQLSSGTLTMPGAFVGTLFYAAPELALGKADHRSDVYSLGATLFHCLTGHPPFRGDALEVLRHHAETEVPMDELAAVPESARGIIARCLKKGPDERYQSCTELAGELEKAAARLAQSADAPTAVVEEETQVEPPPGPEDLTAATEAGAQPSPGATAATAATEVVPPVREEPAATSTAEPRPAAAGSGAAGRVPPAPPARKRAMPSWLPAAGGGLVVAVLAIAALVLLGNIGGDDGGANGGGGGRQTIGRDRLRSMLLPQLELGSEYAAFQLNPDVSGYVASGRALGAVCPAGSASATPVAAPLEAYDNQYEFEQSLVSQAGTFLVLQGVDNFPDEDAAGEGLEDFLANPADHMVMAGCPVTEIEESEDFEAEDAGGDAAGVEQVVLQTRTAAGEEDEDSEMEFAVTAVGFTRETILGKVLIAHFDSPEHQSSASDIAARLAERITRVLSETTPTPTDDGSPSPSGSASPTESDGPGRTRTPAPSRSDGGGGGGGGTQPPNVGSLGCSPASVETGQTVTCNPSVSGTVTSRSWSGGGSPSSGSGSSFSTSYSSTGSKTITLQACNSAGCDSGSQSISVSAAVTPPPSAPSISSLGCSPASVETGQTVTCNPSVSGTVTSRSWSGGGSPASGSGSSFSTSYSSAGTKTIRLEACNSGACSSRTQNITVNAPALGDYFVSADTVTIFPDETATVNIYVDTPSAGLGLYDIDIDFDPSIIYPISCVDYYGSCDPDYYGDGTTVNFYGEANDSGNLIVGSITFGVVDSGYTDLFVFVYDMFAQDGTDVFDYVVEIDGGVDVLLYIF